MLKILKNLLKQDIFRESFSANGTDGRHDRVRQVVVFLEGGLVLLGAVDLVQLGESRLGPHAQTADVVTRSQLQ